MVVKKKIVLLFTAIIAVIAISLLVRAGGSDIKLKKQLDLGQKYLVSLIMNKRQLVSLQP